MPDWLVEIPGLHVDYQAGVVEGSPDAVEAASLPVEPKVELIAPGVPTHPLIRKYQRDAAEWLLKVTGRYRGAILADDMGLGKTRTAIYAASLVPNSVATLIIAPASVLYQWQDEAKLFDIPVTVLGPKTKTIANVKAWHSVYESKGWYAVSPNLAEDALERFGRAPTTVIFDEPHMYLRGRQGKWAWGIADHLKLVERRIACTGTPMYNMPRDMWTMLFLLFGMRFGKAKEFDKRYCGGRQGTYGWQNDGATNIPELKRRLTHYMLRRTLTDVQLELPPITTSFRWVKGSDTAKAAMLQSHGSAQGVDGALDKCLNEKIEEVINTALTLDQPCVIWTYHPHHATHIARLLEQNGKHCLPISGEQSVQERHTLIQQAAKNKWSIAATIDSCGTGVNMQGVASTAIFHTIQRIPKKTHQAMKRLHRSGQKNPVHCIFIAMKDAMDEIVVDTVIKKLDYWNALMGEDDVESNVGGAVRSTKETEDAVLRAIYEEMQ